MRWNDHSKDFGDEEHAFLGASKYSWLNYDEEKLIEKYLAYTAKERGTRLHAIAQQLIDERIKLPRVKQTLNMYVNDGIGFKMDTEVKLKYSEFCFGTADSIYFSDKKKILRISDYKSGVTKASFHQLEIYMALFCLEYEYRPVDLKVRELRIYQNNEIMKENPEAEVIDSIIYKIIDFDKKLRDLKVRGIV